MYRRKRCVKISNSRTSWAVLAKGMHQGSILGPLLFNIVMNELFVFIQICRLYNYADDNYLDSSSENLVDVLYNLRHDDRNTTEWLAKMVWHICCQVNKQVNKSLKRSTKKKITILLTWSYLIKLAPPVSWYSGFVKLRISYSNLHYSDVIMDTMTSQITGVSIAYSTAYSGEDQRKHQSSASLAFVRGIHRWPVNFPHKEPVARKLFPFDDVIMFTWPQPVMLKDMFNAKYVPHQTGNSRFLGQSNCSTTTFCGTISKKLQILQNWRES